MVSKSDVIENVIKKAFELGFEDIGFTTAEPLRCVNKPLFDGD